MYLFSTLCLLLLLSRLEQRLKTKKAGEGLGISLLKCFTPAHCTETENVLALLRWTLPGAGGAVWNQFYPCACFVGKTVWDLFWNDSVCVFVRVWVRAFMLVCMRACVCECNSLHCKNEMVTLLSFNYLWFRHGWLLRLFANALQWTERHQDKFLCTF